MVGQGGRGPSPSRCLDRPSAVRTGPDRAGSRSCFQGPDRQGRSPSRTERLGWTGQSSGQSTRWSMATRGGRWRQRGSSWRCQAALEVPEGDRGAKKITRASSSATNLARRPVDGDEKDDARCGDAGPPTSCSLVHTIDPSEVHQWTYFPVPASPGAALTTAPAAADMNGDIFFSPRRVWAATTSPRPRHALATPPARPRHAPPRARHALAMPRPRSRHALAHPR